MHRLMILIRCFAAVSESCAPLIAMSILNRGSNSAVNEGSRNIEKPLGHLKTPVMYTKSTTLRV